jgi:hypothetical protein
MRRKWEGPTFVFRRPFNQIIVDKIFYQHDYGTELVALVLLLIKYCFAFKTE